MTQSGHLACYHSISVMTMMPGAALGSQAYKQCRALLEDKMSIENDVPADRTSPARAAEISRSGLRVRRGPKLTFGDLKRAIPGE
jgi:hypothetical protein